MTSEYRKGAENIPLRQINNHCPIYVLIRNLRAVDEEDDVVQEFRMDLSNPEDRKHLGRLTYWCTNNHHSIETMSLADAEGNEK
jgi:hypothetical protein